jgi:flagellar biosynthesis/type III secretory pathway chaperone
VASLMETLMEVLEKENTEYEKLVELSKEKTPVIVAGDIKTLQEIVDKEQPIVDVISKLEREREEVIKDIAIVLNKEVSALKLKNIIHLLKGQPKEQNKLALIHDKLSSTVKTMAVFNENNKMLLEHSLEMVQFEINLYQSTRKAPETANYGKDAYSTGDVLINSNGFDAKQ